jgi:hypothetical protein
LNNLAGRNKIDMSETEKGTPRTPREAAQQLTIDEVLSLLTQLLGEVSVRGHRVRTMNHNGALIIQVASVQREVGESGAVRLVPAAAQPAPETAPVAP